MLLKTILLGAASSASASLLIDDFSVASSLVQSVGPTSQTQTVTIDGQNATRDLIASGNPPTSDAGIQSTGSVLNVALVPATNETLIVATDYSEFEADISTLPFFQVDLAATSQPILLGMIFRSSKGPSIANVIPVEATSTEMTFEPTCEP